jgi:RNA methyltransferase, TrmH family
MERLVSRQNPIVKRFREVARARGSDDAVLLDGAHLVEEALRSGTAIDVAAFADRGDPHIAELAARLERTGAQTMLVTDQVLSAMSPVRHPSGVVAIGRLRPATVADVLGRAPQLVLLLAGIQDAGNVGAIIRAGEGCGATGIVTTDGTADPFGWKALRGAMGSTFRFPVALRQPLRATVETMRAKRIRLIATVPRAGTPLSQCNFRAAAAILLGGEGAGLPEDILASSDEHVTIPMRPPVESLNVAITAALILYEASRQREALVESSLP